MIKNNNTGVSIRFSTENKKWYNVPYYFHEFHVVSILLPTSKSGGWLHHGTSTRISPYFRCKSIKRHLLIRGHLCDFAFAPSTLYKQRMELDVTRVSNRKFTANFMLRRSPLAAPPQMDELQQSKIVPHRTHLMKSEDGIDPLFYLTKH